jgi:gamma-glutamyltranspeptidase/glutathione hydrolase
MKKEILSKVTKSMILISAGIFLFTSSCSTGDKREHDPSMTINQVRSPLVVSYHKLAQDVGYDILSSGGNAFDAYVAVTAVENVVSAGYVTFAGLMSTLVFHAKSEETYYMDAGFNSVLDPDGIYDPEHPSLGKTVVVPGVIAGLESISKRWGRMSFKDVLQPAIAIARDGFVIDEVNAHFIQAATQTLQRTEYGRRVFLPDEKALQAGDVLKQTKLAAFLSKLSEQGADHMYRGDWAKQCVETVKKEGGLMTLNDLDSYRPTWTQPWRMSYRGFDIYASSGRSMYALWALLAVKTLEHTRIQQLGHYSDSADALETMIRIARAVDEETWIHDYQCLDDQSLVNSRLTSSYTDSIWAKVIKAEDPAPYEPQTDHSTLCSIIADAEGNVVTGKHSINSELWGNGMFVQGVLLNGSGDMQGRFTGLGQRRTQGAPNFLVFKDGTIKYALGTFSSSNPHAAFQFLVNLLDYGLPADQSVESPRFGSFPYDETDWSVDFTKNWLDERISQEIVDILKNRGIDFSQKRPRLGKGCIAEFLPDGGSISGYDRTN